MNAAGYDAAMARVESDPDGYWTEVAGRLDWMKPFTQVKDVSFDAKDFRVRWYADGVLNVSVNCIDRHLPERADQTAFIWESDDGKTSDLITYGMLHAEVCRMANVLKAKGVKKGDRVTIYLPMIPQAAYAMLACARIGAIHSVIFGGFSPDSIAGRILDCDSRIVITADEGLRGGKAVPLKRNVDEALAACPDVTDVIVVRRTRADVPMTEGRDVFYSDVKATVSDQCDPEPMNAEDPLFILYTSGSTGKPKGVLHTTGGYLTWAAHTHELVFDYRPGEVFWCTADVGWVTGHSYVVYGPLANAATSVMFEGVPNYPDRLALLGGLRQAQGADLLYRADGDPLADARGRRAGDAHLAQLAAPAGHGGRADQSRGLALVPPRGGRGALPDRRHLVADRDRRLPDDPAARRDAAEARLLRQAPAGGEAAAGGTPTARSWRARSAATCA